jgi:hypothetical protein
LTAPWYYALREMASDTLRTSGQRQRSAPWRYQEVGATRDIHARGCYRS